MVNSKVPNSPVQPVRRLPTTSARSHHRKLRQTNPRSSQSNSPRTSRNIRTTSTYATTRQPPHIIQGYEYATHSPGDPNVKCPRCKLKHHISEPCDRFMNEFDVRMMLDQLRNVPPASTEPQKIRVAETYLRDKLKKISAARRARGIHNAEVIMRS
jgi:hypothetical protein